MTLHERYLDGERFPKVTVVKLGERKNLGAGWFVVPPGSCALGTRYSTWEAAIRAALNGR